MLTSFILGTGGFNIGGLASLFGIPGGRSLERSFHRRSSKIYDIVISVTATVIQKAMVEDIKVTIRRKLDGNI